MKYPRLTHEEDKRKKLTPSEISEIISLSDGGMSSRKIAAIYGVSKTTILYHCKSGTEKEAINKKRYERLVIQENKDPGFKEKRYKDKLKWQKEVLKRSEAKRKYKAEATNKWKMKKYRSDPEFKAKLLKQDRERRLKRNKGRN